MEEDHNLTPAENALEALEAETRATLIGDPSDSSNSSAQPSKLSESSMDSADQSSGSPIPDDHLGAFLSQAEDVDILGDSSSDEDSISVASSEDSDTEHGSLDQRLIQPTWYFQKLDVLEAQVLQNSSFPFYSVLYSQSLLQIHALTLGSGRAGLPISLSMVTLI